MTGVQRKRRLEERERERRGVCVCAMERTRVMCRCGTTSHEHDTAVTSMGRCIIPCTFRFDEKPGEPRDLSAPSLTVLGGIVGTDVFVSNGKGDDMCGSAIRHCQITQM